MRSFIIAMCILVVLIGGLVATHMILHNLSYQDAETLGIVYNLIEEDKWDESNDVFLVFQEKYQAKENLMKVLVDHAELDNIESSLIATEEFIKVKNKGNALDAAARSIFYIRHLEDKNRFNVENVL